MSFYWQDLGLIPFEKGLEQQEKFHRLCKQNFISGIFLKVEHPPVLTLGKNAGPENLLATEDFFLKAGVKVFKIDRGGDVTAHMPGQLVVYPVLNLSSSKWAPKKFVNTLEGIVIDLCQSYGVTGYRHAEYPGVWVKDKKICAIGIRLRERISTHGIAFNVCNDLGLFSWIVPCGIKDKQVTSLAKEMQSSVSLEEVWGRFLKLAQPYFGEISPYDRGIANQNLSTQPDVPIMGR
jgi:lipoyl(octanoyl) transferase